MKISRTGATRKEARCRNILLAASLASFAFVAPASADTAKTGASPAQAKAAAATPPAKAATPAQAGAATPPAKGAATPVQSGGETDANDHLHSGPGLQDMGVEHFNWGPEKLDAAVKANPRSPTAYIERGNMYLFDTEPEKARADFNKALSLDAKCAKAHIGLSRVCENLLDIPGAIIELDKAARVSTPAYAADALFQKAFLQRESGNLPAALASYDKLIKSGTLSPRREAMAIFQRGETYMRMNRPGEAMVDFNTSLKRDPNREQCHLIRADLYVQMHKPQLAIQDLSWIIDGNHPNITDAYARRHELEKPNVLRKRAAIYKQLGNLGLAARDDKLAQALDKEIIEDSPFMGK
jgi:tetratricopeptide (TPR) repeat protein